MTTCYRLYLVTDSTPAILGDRDLVLVVNAALEGGVTVVQYRDKTSETAELIRMGRELHKVTSSRGIPLLVNDRVDVALAIGAEGVHLGQEDISISDARAILGRNALIGVTCSTPEEAQLAVLGGADYLGIGTMFNTQTKANTKNIIGTAGTKAILDALSLTHPQTPTVAIGGINASNIQRVLFQSRGKEKGLHGVAIVSSIISAKDVKAASAQLLALMSEVKLTDGVSMEFPDIQELLKRVPDVVSRIVQRGPVCHNMTNSVVQNFAANVAIAIGASPIMAGDGTEASDIATFAGALVINLGSVCSISLESQIQALEAYNKQGKPALLDPVGVGATVLRRAAVKTLLSKGHFEIIKGNQSEIIQILEDGVTQQKGVDSGPSDVAEEKLALITKKLACRQRNIVLMTGEVDFLSDGEVVLALRNGHRLLSRITGSGCTLGTVIACCISVERQDKLLAALAGILLFNIAAELAATFPTVQGPGTFVPAFIDSLCKITDLLQKGDSAWFLDKAKVEVVKGCSKDHQD